MKFLKSTNILVLFDELSNHGAVAHSLDFLEVDTAGFANIHPMENSFRLILSGGSSTLKINSNRIEDNLLATDTFKFSEDVPTAFIIDQFEGVYIVPMVHATLIHERLLAAYPGGEFIQGTFYLKFLEDNDPYANSDWKAEPVILTSSSPLTDDHIRRLSYNFLAK